MNNLSAKQILKHKPMKKKYLHNGRCPIKEILIPPAKYKSVQYVPASLLNPIIAPIGIRIAEAGFVVEV